MILFRSDDAPTKQEMLPDPPSISLAAAVPINISHHVPQAHHAPTLDQPITIAPFSHPSTQNYDGGDYHPAPRPDNYNAMNHECLRKKYRRKYENPQRMGEVLAEQTIIVENLQTAVEGKMDVAAIGVLSSIINSLDGSAATPDTSVSKATVDSGDKQRALYKAGEKLFFIFLFNLSNSVLFSSFIVCPHSYSVKKIFAYNCLEFCLIFA